MGQFFCEKIYKICKEKENSFYIEFSFLIWNKVLSMKIFLKQTSGICFRLDREILRPWLERQLLLSWQGCL